jgi:apolipoprotein N-acyltransferase
VARRFVRDEPQLIVNVTNDAWFRDSEGADQHLANAIFRAIELRRPLIRTANTGVTAVIDPLGRVTHQLPRLQEGVLLASIPLPTTGGLTFYARHGDLFAQSLLGLVLLATLHAAWRARQHPRSPHPTP